MKSRIAVDALHNAVGRRGDVAAWVQPSHGNRLFATYCRSRWSAPVHGHGGLESQFDSCVTIRRVGLTTEEGCVTFDLDQVEALGRRSPSQAVPRC
jgi:hypothetical protein